MKPSATQPFRLALAAAICAGTALVASAQDDASAPPSDSAAAPASPAPAAPGDSGDSGAAPPAAGAGEAAQQAGPSPPPADEDEFVPSEEIPADEEVTFPVNI